MRRQSAVAVRFRVRTKEELLSTQLDTEWGVVQAVLRSMSVSRRQLVVRESRDLMHGFGAEAELLTRADAYLRERLGDLPQDLLVSFRTANAIRHDLSAVFPALAEACTLVGWSELEAGFWGKLGWWGIRLRYPFSSGVVSLSRVGFDKDRSQALACCGRHSGPRSGAGWFKLFRKTSGEWRVAASAVAWIS